MLVIEDILGRCAPLLGIDPIDLRRRNFYVEGQDTPYGQPVRHPERSGICWDQVLTTGDVAARKAEIAAYNASHEHTKRALAMTPGEVRDLVQLHRRSTRPARSCTSTRTARC